MTNYKKLDVWIKSMETVKEVYNLVRNFPKEEVYGLTSQIKRAVISIPSNIAEGLGRNHKKDTIQFLHISRGSAYEVETLLNVAQMVKIISDEPYEKLGKLLERNIS